MGVVTVQASIAYLAQNLYLTPMTTVAELLGAQEKLIALERILQDSIDSIIQLEREK